MLKMQENNFNWGLPSQKESSFMNNESTGVDQVNVSKKKVLLFLPNHNWAHEEERYTKWILFPTQICLVAAQIEDKYEVKVYDGMLSNISQQEFEDIIRREKPDIVGMSNFTHEYSKAGHITVDIVKKVDPKIITVMGGVYVITSPHLAIKNLNLDYGLIGEGELLFKELLEHLYEDGPMPEKGLVFRQNGQVIIQERADFIQDLSSLKLPAYHLVDFAKYTLENQRKDVGGPREYPFARVIMTRGCPVGCTFCEVEAISGKITRYRSAEHMVSEIKMLKEKYGVKFFIFDDDNMLINKRKAKEMLQLLIDENLNIKWLSGATAIFNMDDEMVDLYVRSGCVYLNVSVESGSPRVLRDIIKKPIDLVKVKEMVVKVKNAGMDVVVNFVLGSPGETWEEIRQTIKYAEDLNIDYVKFFICTPLPGTKMFEMAKEMGYLDDSLIFDEHHWSFGTFNTPHWDASELAILRAYEWDRINFSTSEKTKKIAEMMGISDERLEIIRRETRSRVASYFKPTVRTTEVSELPEENEEIPIASVDNI